MKAFLLLLVGFIVGGAVGLVGGGVVGTGVGAGIGVATGLQAGACLTVEAAREQGLITAEQVDDIFVAAAESIRAQAEELNAGPGADFANSDAECREVVARLKADAAH